MRELVAHASNLLLAPDIDHPPRSDWVNNHQFCLHLWRPVCVEIPRPPKVMVGYQSAGVMA